jgi:hypothetical protein
MKSTCKWLVLAALLVVAVPAAAQETDPPAEEATTEEQSALDLLSDDVDVSGIEQILRGEEAVFEGKIFSYDRAGRRDPFRSLLRGFEDEEEGPARERPPGLPGMLVEELKVEGIIQTPSGILAFVLGRDNVSYIIRPGTKLFNGEVAEIQPTRVVFRQQVNDSGRVKEYDEIVRDLAE